ncbi:MAG: hypothetical protein V4537_15885 [Pseudomonadota bacterium]
MLHAPITAAPLARDAARLAIHRLDCPCIRCTPAHPTTSPLSRRAGVALIAIGILLGAICDGLGLHQPLAIIGL